MLLILSMRNLRSVLLTRSKCQLNHYPWGKDNDSIYLAYFRAQVPDNNGVEFVGTDICMMDSAFNFEYEEFEKYLVDKK